MSKLFGNGHLRVVGIEGEEVAKRFLDQFYDDVKDVRSDPDYQRKDIDFVVQNRGLNVEVKTDRHISQTHNFCFEVLRIQHYGQLCGYLGWSIVSKASHFVIYCPPSQRIYTCTSVDARQGFQRYVLESPSKIRITTVPSDDERTTINVLVPICHITHSAYEYQNGLWKRVKDAL